MVSWIGSAGRLFLCLFGQKLEGLSNGHDCVGLVAKEEVVAKHPEQGGGHGRLVPRERRVFNSAGRVPRGAVPAVEQERSAREATPEGQLDGKQCLHLETSTLECFLDAFSHFNFLRCFVLTLIAYYTYTGTA